MDDELAQSLRHMQSHPTTGEPHNQQVISTQVETIFAIDGLTNEIKNLSELIDKSNKQSKKLEQSNYNLQVGMLFLTFVATTATIAPFIHSAIKAFVTLITNTNPTLLTNIFTALMSLLAGFATSYFLPDLLGKYFKINEKK